MLAALFYRKATAVPLRAMVPGRDEWHDYRAALADARGLLR